GLAVEVRRRRAQRLERRLARLGGRERGAGRLGRAERGPAWRRRAALQAGLAAGFLVVPHVPTYRPATPATPTAPQGPLPRAGHRARRGVAPSPDRARRPRRCTLSACPRRGSSRPAAPRAPPRRSRR